MSLVSELTDAYEEFYSNTQRTINKNAEKYASLISNAFHTGLSPMQSLLAVTGFIPGSPPTPYVGTESVTFGDHAQQPLLETELYKIKIFMNSDIRRSTLLRACREEAKIIINALSLYFNLIIPLVVHTGNVVSTIPPTASYKESLALQLRSSVYDFVPGNRTRATLMANSIISVLNPWIASIVLSGAVIFPPADGNAIGNWIPVP